MLVYIRRAAEELIEVVSLVSLALVLRLLVSNCGIHIEVVPTVVVTAALAASSKAAIVVPA